MSKVGPKALLIAQLHLRCLMRTSSQGLLGCQPDYILTLGALVTTLAPLYCSRTPSIEGVQWFNFQMLQNYTESGLVEWLKW
jgi:hypothetical protein